MKAIPITPEEHVEGWGTTAEIDTVKEMEENPNCYKYKHLCVTCFAKNENLEVTVAERLIKAKRTEKHIRRCERWQYAKANIAEFFKMDEVPGESGTSKKVRVRATVCVAMSEMKDFFAPMLKILALKAMDEELALQAAKDYQAWVKENPGADDAARGLMVDQRLDEAMNKWRSFHSKGDAATAFCLAADYADEWFGSLDKQMRVYYVAGLAERSTRATR